MPITKRFHANDYLEDFEEIDEHSPWFSIVEDSKILKEEKNIIEKKKITNLSFWEKCKTFLKLKFQVK